MWFHFIFFVGLLALRWLHCDRYALICKACFAFIFIFFLALKTIVFIGDFTPANHALLPMRVGAGSEIVSRGSRMAELIVRGLAQGVFPSHFIRRGLSPLDFQRVVFPRRKLRVSHRLPSGGLVDCPLMDFGILIADEQPDLREVFLYPSRHPSEHPACRHLRRIRRDGHPPKFDDCILVERLAARMSPHGDCVVEISAFRREARVAVPSVRDYW